MPYLVFLPLVVIIYYVLPVKFRWILLLLASYFFYGFLNSKFLILILGSTLVDYIASNRIEQSESDLRKKLWLWFSLTFNIGLLFLFKYLKLFLSPKDLMQVSIAAAEMPLKAELYYALYLVIPVGISFYTFQTMSYTLDVYSGKIRAEKHLGKFALFVAFFPQLVAGPIERFSRLRPQLNLNFNWNWNTAINGLRLILFGFFLKLCIADNLVQTVDPVYEDPGSYSRLNIIIGTLLFGFQIYCDFAGYTLVAQGSALLLGIKLMDNFRTPYLSKSISEFWQRWHISLSTWFRDYLYLPLGGNRVRRWRWGINILLVFTISGFWHGAEWTFLIWGAIHGLVYLLERLVQQLGLKFKGKALIDWVITFSAVSIAWVFFRAGDMKNIKSIYDGIVMNSGNNELYFSDWLLIPVTIFLLSEFLLYNKRFDTWISVKPFTLRWFIYASLLYCVLALGGAVNHPFIYFRF